MEGEWAKYHSDILGLIPKMGNYRPDVIAPVMIGGLVPCAILAKALGIYDVRPIDIGRKDDERWLSYDVQGGIEGKRILILEDDLKTGKGPLLVKKIFEERGAHVKIGAIYVRKDMIEKVDYYSSIDTPKYPYKKLNMGDKE